MLCKYCTNTLCISKCSSRFVFHFQTFCVILSRAIVRATHTHTPTLCCWILNPMVCAYSAVHGIKIFFTRLRVPSDGMIGAAHLRLQTRRIQVAPISINVCVCDWSVMAFVYGDSSISLEALCESGRTRLQGDYDCIIELHWVCVWESIYVTALGSVYVCMWGGGGGGYMLVGSVFPLIKFSLWDVRGADGRRQ